MNVTKLNPSGINTFLLDLVFEVLDRFYNLDRVYKELYLEL